MKAFTTLIKLLLVSTVFCTAGQTYAKDSNAVSKILWERDFGCSNNLGCSLGTATFSKVNDKLLIAGTSFRPKVYSEGKFWLWEIDQNGKRIKNTVLANAPKDRGAIMRLGAILISGVTVSSNRDVFVAGKFNGSTSSFMKMDRQGRRIFSRRLSKKSLKRKRSETIIILKMINLTDSNFLLIGKDNSDNALIMKVDSKGNRLWKRTYDLGRLDFFTDGVAVGNKGDFLVVGCSANFKGIASVEPSDIYVLRCDAQGKVLSEKVFAGNSFVRELPQVCQLNSGDFVVSYDKSIEMKTTDLRIKAFSPDLTVELWERQVAKLESSPVLFKIAATPKGNFVVGSCVNITDIKLYEYDKEGNMVSSISADKVGSVMNLDLACTEGKAFIVLESIDKSYRNMIKVIAIELNQPKKGNSKIHPFN